VAPRYYQVPNKWWWMSSKNSCHQKMLPITVQMLFVMRLVKILGSLLRKIGSLGGAGLHHFLTIRGWRRLASFTRLLILLSRHGQALI
jgi:hypothetical protein